MHAQFKKIPKRICMCTLLRTLQLHCKNKIVILAKHLVTAVA